MLSEGDADDGWLYEAGAADGNDAVDIEVDEKIPKKLLLNSWTKHASLERRQHPHIALVIENLSKNPIKRESFWDGSKRAAPTVAQVTEVMSRASTYDHPPWLTCSAKYIIYSAPVTTSPTKDLHKGLKVMTKKNPPSHFHFKMVHDQDARTVEEKSGPGMGSVFRGLAGNTCPGFLHGSKHSTNDWYWWAHVCFQRIHADFARATQLLTLPGYTSRSANSLDQQHISSSILWQPMSAVDRPSHSTSPQKNAAHDIRENFRYSSCVFKTSHRLQRIWDSDVFRDLPVVSINLFDPQILTVLGNFGVKKPLNFEALLVQVDKSSNLDAMKRLEDIKKYAVFHCGKGRKYCTDTSAGPTSFHLVTQDPLEKLIKIAGDLSPKVQCAVGYRV
ncbi:hypothetical protein F4604DRAFT_1922327 [Suillus subluteus]|nr:hypothetical protein F4604DRAFT_1922327 [Suillus subluteus]